MLIRFATALLYVGPLMAGLAGQGWAMVPLFWGIFLLSSVILHPAMWPVSRADLMRSDAAVALASLVATQALLVVVSFAFGRGIGGVLAVQPPLPTYLPAALSLMSVPLARWSGRPLVVVPETFDLDGAVRLVLGSGEAELPAHLSALMGQSDPVALRRALGQQGAVAARALILHATDPATRAGAGYMAQAFGAAAGDAGHLALFARRCLLALEGRPGLAADCPTPDALREAAQGVDDAGTAAALRRLARFLDRAP